MERLRANLSVLPESYRHLSNREMDERIQQAKDTLGRDLVMMGHHYQRDEVFRFADFTGDSLELARIAERQSRASYIVFCGVHFMAETADILTKEEQIVILPDRRAGCSMADMATIDELEEAWEVMQQELGDTILPVTYVNSSADIKSFVGRHGGVTCTSSNAAGVLKWAFSQKEENPVPSGSAPGTEHFPCHGNPLATDGRLGSDLWTVGGSEGTDGGASCSVVEGILLGSYQIYCGSDSPNAGAGSGNPSDCPSRVYL